MKKQIEKCKKYCISLDGEITNSETGKVKSPYLCKNGYLYVDLWENNKSHKYTIHRLIAEAFLPNPQNKPTVDHIDGNRQNNSIDNLRWATYSEQNSRFNTVGVRSEKILATHENGNIIEFDSITLAAKYFNCTVSNISQMLKMGSFWKRGKTHHYKFEYATA